MDWNGIIEAFIGQSYEYFGFTAFLMIPVIVAVYYLLRHRHQGISTRLEKPGDPSILGLARKLSLNSPFERYICFIKKLNANLGLLFGPVEITKQNSFVAKLFGCQPWTTKTFDRALLLSVLYPLFFMYVSWLVTGNVVVAGVRFLPESSVLVRVSSLVVFVTLSFLISKETKKLPFFTVTFFVFALSLVLMGILYGVSGGLLAIVGFLFVLVITSAACYTTSAGGLSVIFLLAVILVSAVLLNTIAPPVDTIALGIAFVVAASLVVIFNLAKISLRNTSGALLLLIISLVIIVLFLFDLYFVSKVQADGLREPLIIIMFFSGFLPIANAVFDWLSIGATRGLLSAIAVNRYKFRWVIVASILDVVFAVILLLCVAVTSVIGLWAYNEVLARMGAEPFIALPDLWVQLKMGGWLENLWIWLMLASTLVPSILHFVMAVFSFAVLFPKKSGRQAVYELKKAHYEFKKRDSIGVDQDPQNVCVPEDVQEEVIWDLFWSKVLALIVPLLFLFPIIYLVAGFLPDWVEAIFQWIDHRLGTEVQTILV